MPARRRPSRLGGWLVLLGCLGVLGGTFWAGYMVGRHGSRVAVVTGVSQPRAQADVSRESAPAARRPAAPEPMPRLTFYQELTAPLAAPPQPGRPASPPARTSTPDVKPAGARSSVQETAAPRGPVAPDAKPSEPKPTSGPQQKQTAETKAIANESKATSPGQQTKLVTSDPTPTVAESSASSRFSVQVAAYANRIQANAVRDRLAAQGFGAAVSETMTTDGARYRVRVGSFATRDEARAEAGRVTVATRLAPVVVRDAGGGQDGR